MGPSTSLDFQDPGNILTSCPQEAPPCTDGSSRERTSEMTMADKGGCLIPTERLDNAIIEVRGRKVMLSRDLAALYGVSTKAFNQAVKRNAERFPEDFMFQLTREEAQSLRSQSVTSNEAGSRSQIVTLNGRPGRGGQRYRPYAFSEHGAVMAATILNSPRAVEVSVFVVRAFVRLSRVAADQRQFAPKLAEIEAKLSVHDQSLKTVFDALRQLMQPSPAPKRRKIGFATDPDDNIIAHDRPARQHRGR